MPLNDRTCSFCNATLENHLDNLEVASDICATCHPHNPNTLGINWRQHLSRHLASPSPRCPDMSVAEPQATNTAIPVNSDMPTTMGVAVRGSQPTNEVVVLDSASDVKANVETVDVAYMRPNAAEDSPLKPLTSTTPVLSDGLAIHNTMDITKGPIAVLEPKYPTSAPVHELGSQQSHQDGVAPASLPAAYMVDARKKEIDGVVDREQENPRSVQPESSQVPFPVRPMEGEAASNRQVRRANQNEENIPGPSTVPALTASTSGIQGTKPTISTGKPTPILSDRQPPAATRPRRAVARLKHGHYRTLDDVMPMVDDAYKKSTQLSGGEGNISADIVYDSIHVRQPSKYIPKPRNTSTERDTIIVSQPCSPSIPMHRKEDIAVGKITGAEVKRKGILTADTEKTKQTPFIAATEAPPLARLPHVLRGNHNVVADEICVPCLAVLVPVFVGQNVHSAKIGGSERPKANDFATSLTIPDTQDGQNPGSSSWAKATTTEANNAGVSGSDHYLNTCPGAGSGNGILGYSCATKVEENDVRILEGDNTEPRIRLPTLRAEVGILEGPMGVDINQLSTTPAGALSALTSEKTASLVQTVHLLEPVHLFINAKLASPESGIEQPCDTEDVNLVRQPPPGKRGAANIPLLEEQNLKENGSVPCLEGNKQFNEQGLATQNIGPPTPAAKYRDVFSEYGGRTPANIGCSDETSPQSKYPLTQLPTLGSQDNMSDHPHRELGGPRSVALIIPRHYDYVGTESAMEPTLADPQITSEARLGGYNSSGISIHGGTMRRENISDRVKTPKVEGGGQLIGLRTLRDKAGINENIGAEVDTRAAHAKGDGTKSPRVVPLATLGRAIVGIVKRDEARDAYWAEHNALQAVTEGVLNEATKVQKPLPRRADICEAGMDQDSRLSTLATISCGIEYSAEAPQNQSTTDKAVGVGMAGTLEDAWQGTLNPIAIGGGPVHTDHTSTQAPYSVGNITPDSSRTKLKIVKEKEAVPVNAAGHRTQLPMKIGPVPSTAISFPLVVSGNLRRSARLKSRKGKRAVSKADTIDHSGDNGAPDVSKVSSDIVPSHVKNCIPAHGTGGWHSVKNATVTGPTGGQGTGTGPMPNILINIEDRLLPLPDLPHYRVLGPTYRPSYPQHAAASIVIPPEHLQRHAILYTNDESVWRGLELEFRAGASKEGWIVGGDLVYAGKSVIDLKFAVRAWARDRRDRSNGTQNEVELKWPRVVSGGEGWICRWM